tara:strand:- start:99 stop:824 length:726 start_codon:yes stop_codon:yes gene_type:complete
MERQGNFLFKYRGQFPIILFALAIPFLYSTDYSKIADVTQDCLLLTAITISIAGFLIRFYTIGTTPRGTSGRNTKEQIADVLNSTGMYSIVRHPLYLGNYLIWVGIAGASFNVYFIVILSLIFWVYYERIIFAEEQFLESKFGNDYVNWSSRLPAFFPSIRDFKKSKTSFSILTILRREYASVLAAVIGFTFIELIKHHAENNNWYISTLNLRILIAALMLVLILKSLRKFTTFLSEKDRS